MTLSREDLRKLHQEAEPPWISVYLPTHRSGPERQQDPIRLKNLLREAEEQLRERGEERGEELLAAGRALLDDTAFWQGSGDGLAVFLAPGLLRSFRGPAGFPERALVGERPHLAPLLALLSGDGRFHILALSQNQVRLFEATRDAIHQLELGEVPHSLQDALRIDEVVEALQYHAPGGGPQATALRAGVAAGTRGGGRRGAIFHGHGGIEDDTKDLVRRYVQVVDDKLVKLLRRRPAPLVLAAVEWEQAIYREVSGHPQLVAQGIEGNPEPLSAEQLHERAWPLVEPVLGADRQRAARAIEELGTERSSRDLEAVLTAAVDGRIDSLFVDISRPRWGRFDETRRVVEVHEQRQPRDEDLVDRAATETLLHSGSVFVVGDGEMPGGNGPLAALFRY